MKEIKRGEIYAVDFGAGFGSEQGGIRPILILQNNTGNKHSPTTIVAAITGRKTKAALPTHVKIMAKGLKTESTVLLEQIRTIDKARLGEYIGRLDSKTLAAVDRAIVVSLGIKYLEELLNG
jgi:mRNA interferase MazF